jgi:AcrR family transcriptional regulator
LTVIGRLTNNRRTMARPSQQIDQALLAAGRALLPELGCAGLSVRALAAQAGVAPGMFHYHFGSKERFLRTLLAALYEEMFGALSAQVALPAEPLERLRAALRLLARFARTHRRVIARLWSDALAGEPVARDFFAQHAQRHIGLMLQLVAQAQREGVLRAQTAPLAAIAFLMGSIALPLIFFAGLVESGLPPPGGPAAFDAQVTSDAAIERRIDLALAVLAAPAAAAPARKRR